MGGSSGQSSSRGGVAPPQAAPRKMYKPPVDANGQTVITSDLKGNPGGAWTPAQIKAGGRWEVPAGAPAGAIGRNFVPYTPPPEPVRQDLARIMAQPQSNSATRNGIYYPGNGTSAWSEGGRGGSYGGFGGTQGAGGYSGWGGGGRGNQRSGGLY